MRRLPSREEGPIKQRILTAALALPLLLLLIAYASPLLFSFFLALVLLLALLEFNRMGLADEHRLEQAVAAIVGSFSVPLLYWQHGALALPLGAVALMLLALLFLFRLSDLSQVPRRLGWLCLGLFYLPFLFGHLLLLRLLPDGQAWIFMTLFVIMVCDSAAYFVGRRFGKRKLSPRVSPNKSVEGAVGGLAGATVAVLLTSVSFLPQIGFFDGLLVGLLLGVLGQLGDLFESLLKRACDVKDSGQLIPGHGGLLDRLDSLLFAFPVVYLLARYGYGG